MDYKTKHTSTFNFLVIILFMSAFCLSRITLLNNVGTISLIILFAFELVFIFKKKIKIKSRSLALLLTLFCLLIVFNSSNIFSSTIIKEFSFILILIMSFITFNVRFDYESIKFTLYRFINIVFYIFVVIGFILLRNGNNIFFPNTAGIAHIAFISMILNYFLYKKKKLKVFDFAIYLPLLFLSNGRIQIFSILLIIIMMRFSEKRIKNKVYYWSLFLIFVLSAFFITYYYPKMYYNPIFYNINLKVRKITKKNLFSGRQYLWESALNEVGDHSWFGFGTDGLYTNSHYTTNVSIHNQYLQLYYNQGLVGILLLLLILRNIWKNLHKYSNDKNGLLCILYFYSFLLINIFSVSLFQNNTFVACYFWSSLGIMLSLCNEKNNVEGDYK